MIAIPRPIPNVRLKDQRFDGEKWVQVYDESSDFSLSLLNTSLVPEGFPEVRTNSPFARRIP